MPILGRIALLAVISLLAAGCSVGTDTEADSRPRVVATTTQAGSLAREIGGEAIDLTVLMEPGIEAHDFELTPEAGAALEEADVILVNGAGLEAWLSDALATIGGAEKVRDLSENVELRSSDVSAAETDPHYWLSGPNAIVMTGNVQRVLAEAVPTAADEVDARAEALIGRLEAADAEVRELIGEIPEPRRKIVTDHDALGYFIDEYGLTFVGSVFPTMDVASEPSARDIEALVSEVRAEGVSAIFTESSVNPRLARAVAEETGARIVDEPIYTDSLGAEGSGAETLDGMLLHNARVIRDGLLGS
jgi:ABC-type Zn uptake system ZnuABC Zn-binding protein ZnuA